MDTTDVLIGVLIIGAGVAVGYSAYKGVPMFGTDGLISEAIRTGKLQAVGPTTTTKGGKGGG